MKRFLATFLYVNYIIVFYCQDFDLLFNSVFFLASRPGRVYRHIIKFKSWPTIKRFKKHQSRVKELGPLAHCDNVPDQLNTFRKYWIKRSGIYKITFKHCRLFTYYGSSSNLGERFKSHYYRTIKMGNFLGLFLKIFGWSAFTITVIEVCSLKELENRENWYLDTFNPLLNVAVKAYQDNRTGKNHSNLTRSKISMTLKSHNSKNPESRETRAKKSNRKSGIKNRYYNKSLPQVALDRAAELKGIKTYVYQESDLSPVNGSPFRSYKKAVAVLPISESTIPKKIDTGIAFKGYYYYSFPKYQ